MRSIAMGSISTYEKYINYIDDPHQLTHAQMCVTFKESASKYYIELPSKVKYYHDTHSEQVP